MTLTVDATLCRCVRVAAVGEAELLDCLRCLMKEQYDCMSKLASSTLSVGRLAQQIVIIERHFIAVERHRHPTKPDAVKYTHRKKMNLEANLSRQKRYTLFILDSCRLHVDQVVLHNKLIIR